tara:strand:- start:718 stop:828 length:111 start_codon:yes stop_codon:yes gene_type:complete
MTLSKVDNLESHQIYGAVNPDDSTLVDATIGNGFDP